MNPRTWRNREQDSVRSDEVLETSFNFVVTMLPRSDDVRQMTDESLAPFHRNRRRLLRKQRHHECSRKANRQLVKRNPPSSSGGTDLRIFLHATLPLKMEVNSTILKHLPRIVLTRLLEFGCNDDNLL
ncbi:unnamed protein product [Protopolystoma xenopodis]|uniref:Uncharacterized protein n=1 Tax=Protopolystoma xenopodis TaxID=117903 RepID=A0A3S4ZSQ8_9PLAT|nr:unnamed protein product [Protopolystoma xenopodis]